MLKSVAILLLALALSSAYDCPSDGTFYHADVSTGCQVYHLCENSRQTTMTCATGQIFDHHTEKCSSADTTHCSELSHHHHKRSVSLELHVISIDNLKESAKKFGQAIRQAVHTSLEEVAPSIHQVIHDEYLPLLVKAKDDMTPFVKDKLLPRMKKGYDYAKRMAKRVFYKLQQSWELSNSTHITIASFSDILEDLSQDAQPVLQLGRYLSSRLATAPTRNRRSTPTAEQLMEMPDMIFQYIEPVLKNVFGQVKDTITGEADTITSKLLVPIFSEILSDPETIFDLKKAYWTGKAAIVPIIAEMLRQQEWDTPEGTVLRIPQERFDQMWEILINETKPTINKIMKKHLSMVLRIASENTNLILDTMDGFKAHAGVKMDILRDAIFRFLSKHGNLFQSSTERFAHTYTLTEIDTDLRPIKVTLIQILAEYLTRNPNSMFGFLFNPQSPFVRYFLGSGTRDYAVPNEDFYKSSPVNDIPRRLNSGHL